MTTSTTQAGILWGRSLLWLSVLAPFFFISYSFCNSLAASRGITQSLAFGWEAHIPLVPWTIIPYWSIDLLYGLSFMVCRSPLEVDRHGLRLLTAQFISISFFLLVPLRFGFERPPIDGFFGQLFNLLAGFDKPYNQAPSLHISLLLIIWVKLAQLGNPWRLLVHIWSALIGVSVLTTYQHHFFDVPTGAAVGLLCLWLWPNQGPPPLALIRAHPPNLRLCFAYLFGATAFAGLAIYYGGFMWWFGWPALALLMVAGNYGLWGAGGFQKSHGRRSLAARLILAPFTLGAWLNARLWTRGHGLPVEVADGVWIGPMPNSRVLKRTGFTGLIDLAPELPCPLGPWHIHSFAWLDLVVPNPQALAHAAQAIETQRQQGTVMVACALGYSRSACAVLAWLICTNRAASVDEAEALLRKCRPQIVISAAHRSALTTRVRERLNG